MAAPDVRAFNSRVKSALLRVELADIIRPRRTGVRGAYDALVDGSTHFSTRRRGSGLRGVDMLRREGAPPGLQGANPGLHAGNVDGCRRVGEIRVVGVQRVGDEPVLL